MYRLTCQPGARLLTEGQLVLATEVERGLGEAILPVLMTTLDDHLGAPWEEAFRQHLRRLASTGRLGPDVVKIGPWWSGDGQAEIDAVVLAGRDRKPVLAGEAKWARRQDASRLVTGLRRKAAPRLHAAGDLRYAVCARERLDDLPPDVLAVTAADIFSAD